MILANYLVRVHLVHTSYEAINQTKHPHTQPAKPSKSISATFTVFFSDSLEWAQQWKITSSVTLCMLMWTFDCFWAWGRFSGLFQSFPSSKKGGKELRIILTPNNALSWGPNTDSLLSLPDTFKYKTSLKALLNVLVLKPDHLHVISIF